MHRYFYALSVFCFVLHARLCVCVNTVITEDGVYSSGSNDVLSLMLDRLTAMDARFNSLDMRITALDQRINGLESRLANQKSTEAETEPSLSPITPTTMPTPSTTTTTTTSTTTQPPKRTQCTITRVTKNETDDGYFVTVKFESTRLPTFVMFRRVFDEVEYPIIVEHVYNYAEVRIPGKVNSTYLDEGLLAIYIAIDDAGCTVYVRLNNENDVMNLPRVEIDVSPPGDLVFEPGSDGEINVTLTMTGNTDDVIDSEDIMYNLHVKSEVEEERVNTSFVTLRGGRFSDLPVWLEEGEVERWTGGWRRTLLTNSTIPDPRGVFDLSMSVQFTPESLVYKLDYVHVVPFHSSRHQGAFPQGFLGFVGGDYSHPDPSRFVCDVRRPGRCDVWCEAEGAEPSTTSITKYRRGGGTRDVMFRATSSGLRSGVQHILEHDTAAGNVTFQCTARSRSGSRQISMDVTVSLIRIARIQRERSHLSRLENGSIALTCVAEGDPRPNITFDVIEYLRDEDYDVTMTQVNETTSQADLMIIDPDAARDVVVVVCLADNAGGAKQFGVHSSYEQFYTDPSYGG